MRRRLASLIILPLGIGLGCGPADEFNPDVGCAEQPGPRGAQHCYALDESRYAAAARNNFEKRALYGADSLAARQEYEALAATLRACGTAPDTTERPTDSTLETWRCRRDSYQFHLSLRASPPRSVPVPP